MPFIIGTAGHIDHGKTSLVKALTGQDTDRLKEEKERGISIELGFAYLDLPDGTRAGVVDVPGHERFIRNMLAGAHGIDLVLFTVAADDGVMPQTEEHLDIVHLLGIRRAIFVITKADLVSDARVAEVEDDINILIAGTRLEGAPMIACSVVSGRGLDDLRRQISQMLDAASGDDRPGGGSNDFRLPVDRVFLLQGHGLVITGTALSGEIRAGDHVRRLPGDQVFRVRSVQVHNQPVDVARRGQRVALNLSGQDKPSIVRGDVIGDQRITLTTDRFDARVEARTMAKGGIKSHQRIRVHLGSAERLGTVIVLAPEQKLAPKQSAFCQIALTEPLAAMRGDRFILRDETAQRTIGGGIVVHPLAHKHKRGEMGLLERLERLQHGSLAEAIDILLTESDEFALAIDPLRQLLNADESMLRTELDRMRAVVRFTLEGEVLYSTESKWRRVKDALLLALRNHHAAQPLSPGMEMEAARDAAAAHTTPRLFRALVERLESERALARDGSLLRLPTHVVRLDDQERTLAERVTALVGHEPFAPPDLKQIEREVGIPSAKLSEVLRVMEREKSIVRVSSDLYFHGGAIDKVKAALFEHLSGANDITPATFRDLFGTTRKYAIPLLEYLDREGFTVRVGDTRRLKR